MRSGPGSACGWAGHVAGPAAPAGRPGSAFDGPGPARGEEAGQVAGAPALVGLEELPGHGRAVLGALDGPEHADRRGLVGAPGQAAQLEGQPGLVAALVVDEQGVLAHVGHLDDAQAAVGLHDHAVLAARPRSGWARRGRAG